MCDPMSKRTKSLQWEYERGRQWATLAPRDIPLRIAGKLNPRAVKLYDISDIL
jgi:hypothetical protein